MRISRLLLLAPLLMGAAGALPLAAVPISRMDTPWWRHRHEEKLAELHRGRVDLVFLGDSITEDWEKSGGHGWDDFAPVWQRFYGDRHALNLGFKGDSTSHLLWRIEHGEVDGIDPKLAVVLIGANNFGRVHWDAEQTLTGIETVLAELHRRLPRTKILLVSVLPSQRSAWVDEQTRALNRALAAHDWRGVDARFIDVTPVFAQEGRLDRALFLDPLLTPPDPPLHPTAQGQEKLAEAIEPAVSAALGDRIHSPR